MKNLYDVLGVTKTASADEIKHAYRRLARELHPDVTGGNRVKTERFKEVVAAYAILSDAKRRGEYDVESSKPFGPGRPSLFGEMFDNLVGRLGTEGIGSHNLDDVLKEMIGVAKDVKENFPKRVQAVVQSTKSPSKLLSLVEDIFDLADEMKGKKP